ncbi:MAG: response regulator, partial [Bryobacteraceae bacterium]
MSQAQWDSRKCEILLVEDNPGDARLIELALAEAPPNVGVCVVQDGKEALDFLYGRGKHAGASLPDLIFLDLNLPQIDGRQVLAQVKKDNHL